MFLGYLCRSVYPPDSSSLLQISESGYAQCPLPTSAAMRTSVSPALNSSASTTSGATGNPVEGIEGPLCNSGTLSL